MRNTARTRTRVMTCALTLGCLLTLLMAGHREGATQTCPPRQQVVNSFRPSTAVYIDLGNLNTEQRRQVQIAIDRWNAANQQNGS